MREIVRRRQVGPRPVHPCVRGMLRARAPLRLQHKATHLRGRRGQGYTDMHVALAAVYWGKGERAAAESEWEFACDKISTGCGACPPPPFVLIGYAASFTPY